MITMTINTRDFDQAMQEVIRLTGAADRVVLQKTMQGIMMNLVRFTWIFRKIRNSRFKWQEAFIERKAKGRAKLGWWPAWKALRMRGAPRIGNGPLRDRREGGIIDRSKQLRDPSITVFNEVPYIDTIDAKNDTIRRAMARQAEFLGRAIDKQYTRILRGRSG